MKYSKDGNKLSLKVLQRYLKKSKVDILLNIGYTKLSLFFNFTKYGYEKSLFSGDSFF